MGTVGAQEGSEAMGEFISGYLTELALTFENASQRSRERERERE